MLLAIAKVFLMLAAAFLAWLLLAGAVLDLFFRRAGPARSASEPPDDPADRTTLS